MSTTGSAAGGPDRGRAQRTRAAILTAAAELFRDQGYDRTSTREIARRAGTTSTTLFRHFGSKTALHARVMTDGAERPAAATPSTRRRGRRSEGETRALLVAAATDLFSRQGYARTSTSQIAKQAGVAEVAVFRHFESKANLFRVAILDPLGALVRRHAEQWNAEDGPGLSRLVEGEFIAELYRSMNENRDALMTLFTTRIREGPDLASPGEQQGAVSEILAPLERAVRREIDAERYPDVDVAVATRLTIAMIGGTVFFQDWLFPADLHVDDERIVAEMRGYVRAAIARSRTRR